ncbi:MAG: cupin [Shewanella sp.]|nr:cupin [Shewanella sp.]
MSATIQLPSSDLAADIDFFVNILGFHLDSIYPADDPAVAVISGFGLAIELDTHSDNSPYSITLRCRKRSEKHSDQSMITAPNGTKIYILEEEPAVIQPSTMHELSVSKLSDKNDWVIGRAGMHYRDLIPSRLGGAIIASHIHIPNGGLVPDMVHFHEVGFQLIYCYRGWVKVVYEDQGPPIILRSGDCVIQPPEIRHRVLESGDDLQVLEISVPAKHITKIDHEMQLPNETLNPDRNFNGSCFVHHIGATSPWSNWRIPGFKVQKTGIAQATQGIADVQIVSPIAGAETVLHQHHGDIVFYFIKEGSLTVNVCEQEKINSTHLSSGDAFVLPPNTTMSFTLCSADCEMVEVSLAADFVTTIIDSENKY